MENLQYQDIPVQNEIRFVIQFQRVEGGRWINSKINTLLGFSTTYERALEIIKTSPLKSQTGKYRIVEGCIEWRVVKES